MLIDLRMVAPGDLPNDIFDEFIAGNNYAPDMVAALRDHLVHGLDEKTAIKQNDVYANKFKMRLETLIAEVRRVGRINALLSVDQNRMNRVFELASDLSKAVDELRLSR
jgi:hypothetical protein